jgi:hypothetical protein
MNQHALTLYIAERDLRNGLDRRAAKQWAIREALRGQRQATSAAGNGNGNGFTAAVGRIATFARTLTRPAAPSAPCAPNVVSDCLQA